MHERGALHLDILGSGEFAIFCGAGISKNSGLPLANELKQCILEKLPLDKKDLVEIMASNLPFEAFMETMSEHGDISRVLDIFEDGKPNTNHILIARLAKNGYMKTVFTTNFDSLIEKALENEGLSKDKDFKVYYGEKQFSEIDFKNIDDGIVQILKIHGSIDNRDSIRTTIKAIASKILSDKRMNVIRYLFSNGNHKKVLILGYSCSDEFDITPQIQNIEENQKEIIFVEHSEEGEEIENIGVKEWKNPFKKLPGKRIKCNTDDFIEDLWTSFMKTIGEYKSIESKVDWKTYVDDWVKELKEGSKYSIVGSTLYKISNFKRAAEYSEKALETVKATGDKKEESRLYSALGTAYYSLGDLKRAVEYSEKALEIAKATGDKAGQGGSYIGLGNAYYCLGDFKRAIEYYDRALEITKAVRDRGGESLCYNNLGATYGRIAGDFKRAIEYFKEALEIVKATGDKKGESRCYTNLANTYHSMENFKGAAEYYERALKITKTIGDRAGQASSYVGLGSAYYGLRDFKRAIECFEKALGITEAIGDRVEETRCYIGLGVAYHGLEDFNRAIKYFEEALEIAKAIGDKVGVSICYSDLGNAYYALEDFNRAIEYYLKAEKIFIEIGQIYFLREAYRNLALVYEKIGDNRNAEDYRRKLSMLENR